MHEGQLNVDAELVASLVAAQFPRYAGAPVRRVHSGGTVNAIFRIGSDVAARLPLLPADAAELEAEASALNEFAETCPFPAPRALGIGAPDAAYPSAWTLQEWLPGTVADPFRWSSSYALADDVVSLIRRLRSAPVAGRSFDGRGRGGNLRDHDEWMAHCLAQSAGIVDTAAVEALWSVLRDLAADGEDRMSHRDLIPANLLVADGRLVGVLDGGAFGPADPSLDLVAAWHLFDEPVRSHVRAAVGAGEAEWLRGAAWALQQAMGLVWYYPETNPPMAELGHSTVTRLLADTELPRR
ncbi:MULTISPECIES: phosphotransferase [Microbacterium]|uniref:phosphotransferase n=1 Tax=Microbacterium TaxID=33882 RepID=UPI00217D2D70|nr:MULTISPECIES: phosphotransferase [Microbacterium]UWF78141.1 phosphotransferase [Microbacterium neungamense]WCM56318.1 phosphotransferase [Microbacterium sp. EF45047]